MKKLAGIICLFFTISIVSISALPSSGQEDIAYVDKQNFVGLGIIVGINAFTDSGLRDIYSPMNVYLGASLSARHKNFVLEAAYEPMARNRVGHPDAVALPREGPEARAWTELDVSLFSTSLLYTVPITHRSIKPYFGGGLAFYSVFERLTAQDNRGNQYYEEADKTLTGFQVQTGIRIYSRNLETKIELKYGSAKGELVFEEMNYGGLTLTCTLHYGFDF
jgi:hypothetical protein